MPALGQAVAEVGRREGAREERVGESLARVGKVQRKVEVCVRQVPQVLLRGEQVVMVAPAL